MTYTLQSWIDRYTEGVSTAERLDLAFGDCHLELRSNSRPLLERLAYYFKDFLTVGQPWSDLRITAIEAPPPVLEVPLQPKDPDPGKSRVKEEWRDLADGRIVRKRLTGMVFLFGGGRHVAIGPCVENYNQVINFVNNRFMERMIRRRHLLCHAAAVAYGHRGLAVAGFSGMGKSTLALSLLSRGATFVSNDRLMIRRRIPVIQMLGVPKLPRINPGTVLHNPDLAPVMPPAERAVAAALPPDELWGLEQKYDCFIDQCFGPNRFRLVAPLDGLLLLNWRRDSSAGPLSISRVDLRSRPDLMPAFMKSVGLFYDSDAEAGAPDADAAQYLHALRDTPVFEATGVVDFDRAADAALRFLLRGDDMPLTRPLS